jgi:ferrous iron transport protein B
MKNSPIKIALVGNPNTGKTSLFNSLTGLNQQVGNYPGITVERKTGSCTLEVGQKATIIDLPGTYSLNPSSADENVVTELLLNPEHKDFPDAIVVVTEIENLKRNLLLFTQIKDLAIPTFLVINMADRMALKGISINIEALEKALNTKIILCSTRKGTGINSLKKVLPTFDALPIAPCVDALDFESDFWETLAEKYPTQTRYKAWLQDTHLLSFVEDKNRTDVTKIKKIQQKETIKRYQYINSILKENYTIDTSKAKDFGGTLDKILTHKVWGYVIFFLVLMLIFQSIFSWSEGAMTFIEDGFDYLSEWVSDTLPEGMLNDLITQGIIAGVAGVMVFIPQIAMLFLFISLLEESGYMSRVVFLMDKIMRKFGLSGKSIVPLISGNACAIPAVMATRNIENWKERLITILVTPFTVCSARLPVYTIIIALIIPEEKVFGFLDMRGLALMGMYIFGIGVAIIAAMILHWVIKLNTKSYFVIEMPAYKVPMFKNVAFNVYEKTKSFVVGAGKIILSIAIVLWFLASYGPGDDFENAAEIVKTNQPDLQDREYEVAVASYQLEHSYIGIMGRTIEPVIKPLGYDWKIGIAIITSFAAREVFVGTLSVIYTVGEPSDDVDEDTITLQTRERMAAEINPVTGKKIYDFPTGMSLLFFYALAMQCMATIAVVKKETNGWKWPLIQLVFMTGLAYLVSFLLYQFLK